MEISGPGHVLVRNGLPFNKYEVVERLRTPKGTLATFYFFDKYKDAEVYYQVPAEYGVESIDIANKRTYLWEKEELREFKASLDLTVLEKAVAKLKFEKRRTILPSKIGSILWTLKNCVRKTSRMKQRLSKTITR